MVSATLSPLAAELESAVQSPARCPQVQHGGIQAQPGAGAGLVKQGGQLPPRAHRAVGLGVGGNGGPPNPEGGRFPLRKSPADQSGVSCSLVPPLQSRGCPGIIPFCLEDIIAPSTGLSREKRGNPAEACGNLPAEQQKTAPRGPFSPPKAVRCLAAFCFSAGRGPVSADAGRGFS